MALAEKDLSRNQDVCKTLEYFPCSQQETEQPACIVNVLLQGHYNSSFLLLLRDAGKSGACVGKAQQGASFNFEESIGVWHLKHYLNQASVCVGIKEPI